MDERLSRSGWPLALVIACLTCGGGPPDSTLPDAPEFSEAVVRRNIELYIATVLGPRSPTQKEYDRFERGEEDVEIEHRLCELCGKVAFERDTPRFYEQCNAWLDEHRLGAPQSRSAYYQILRRCVGASAQRIVIERIVKPPEPGAAFHVFARGSSKGRDVRMEFFHARNETYRDLGWMGLLSVDGVEVDEMIRAELLKRDLCDRVSEEH